MGRKLGTYVASGHFDILASAGVTGTTREIPSRTATTHIEPKGPHSHFTQLVGNANHVRREVRTTQAVDQQGTLGELMRPFLNVPFRIVVMQDQAVSIRGFQDVLPSLIGPMLCPHQRRAQRLQMPAPQQEGRLKSLRPFITKRRHLSLPPYPSKLLIQSLR
jgi:hypothetical protein